MKRIYKYLIASTVVLATSAVLQSCAMEDPFGKQGNGTLSINTLMNGETTGTRAVPENNDYLRENCVVFIENARGVMRKYKGVDNIPSSISLSSGDYVCNAWSGDSVPASFSSKFYRGQQNFQITDNQNTSLLLKCNIANVVVSVAEESLNIGISDMKVTCSTSRGSLEFTKENIPDSKGYFMTPSPEVQEKDPEAYDRNTTLTIKISGKTENGRAYEKIQEVKGIKRAHEYNILVTKEERPISEGGALIRLVIKDIPIIEDTIEVFPAPGITGVDFNVEDQVVNTSHTFADTKVRIYAYKGMRYLKMALSSNFPDIDAENDILSPLVVENLATKGIIVERIEEEVANTEEIVDEVYVTFKADYLNALPESESEYTATFYCTDTRHLEGSGILKIANTDAAITTIDPIVPDPAPNPNNEPMAIGASKATLTGKLYNAEAVSYGFRYREAGQSEWTTALASESNGRPARIPTRAVAGQAFSVTLTGLSDGTTYEYKAFCDDYESNIQTFKTEAKYVIPNSNFTDWSTYKSGNKDIVFPGTGDTPNQWSTGNEGGATVNLTMTDKSTDMFHSAPYSAKLESKKALITIAAGNIFLGNFAGTEGTNGILDLGRPYNGSHPSKLRVWVNYRPGTVDVVGNGCPSDISKGNPDHGQIYVALTTGTVNVRTKDKSTLFSENADYIIAYGQVTWAGTGYGEDGQLAQLDIPLNYKERAQTVKPTHLVIVAAASKFGDYFSGSTSSVMYVDDFELIYE